MVEGGATPRAALTSVTVEAIAAGGDGVGRLPDGLTVFVPRTAPGDVAEIALTELRPRYARARLVRLAAASAVRVAPPCTHYTADRCGGCQLQHLASAAQREAKRRIVGDALRRVAKREVGDPEIVASPADWRYRSKLTLAARGARIGLHPFDRPQDVFDLDDCPITREPLMALWRRVREQRRHFPTGLVRVVLREDRDGGRHVIVEGDAARPWDAAPLARAVGDDGVSFWWRPRGGAARVVAGRRGGFPALAFEQVNRALGGRIRADALAALGEMVGRVAWDLYSGVGDTAAALAGAGATVWAVEVNRTAVEWGRRGTEALEAAEETRATGHVHWVTARVEEALHRLPEADVVVANPPRAGLARRVAEWLEGWAGRHAGRRLVYVSCDPATLARDLARMPSLALVSVTAYDLFPQTSHVETLAVLEAQ